MIKLVDSAQTYLRTAPEYRMGFQKVIATLNTGGVEAGIIVNSQIFLKQDETPLQANTDWDYIVNQSEKSSLRVTSVKLIPREPETLRGVRQIVIANEKFRTLANRKITEINTSYGFRKSELLAESMDLEIKAASAAAKDAPITLTESGQIFKRFSPFADDRRVTTGKGLTPGTFATTKEDSDANVKTGMDAVSRYALPSCKPASNVFTITPAKDAEVQRGTVQPANNQPGGGIEVIFVLGLPDGTVAGPAKIPDK